VATLGRLAGLVRRVPPTLALVLLSLALCAGAGAGLGRASMRWAAAMEGWPAAVEAARAAGEVPPPAPQVEPAWALGPLTLPAPFLAAGPLLLALVLLRARAGAARAEVRALVRRTKREAAAFARSQGHLPAGELRRRLRLPHRRGAPLATGVPLGYLARGAGERGARTLGGTPDPAPHRLCPCGLPWDADTGHVAVVGPARSGKGFHQTDSLLRWPGPAVVVDPKGEQWQRTAGWRRRHVGPVYRVPDVGGGLDLGAYYDLATDRDRRELFALLLAAAGERPEHRIFTERNYPLLPAAVATGAALGEHPLAVLARWARRGDPLVALREAQEHAPEAAAAYLGAVPLQGAGEDRFLGSCWATFTTKLGPVADEIATLTVPPERGGVQADWAAQNATIYVTYPLHEQAAAGPVVAALLVGLVRGLQRRPADTRTLLSIDEAPAVALPRLPTWLATVGGPPAAVTCAVYTQSVPDLERVYGREETRAILSNCAHQVWFPPRDADTARAVSELLGERLALEASASQSAQERGAELGALGGPSGGSAGATLSIRHRPVLTAAQAMALPAGTVVCLSRDLRFLAADSRTALWRAVERLPAPPAPAPETEPEASAPEAAPEAPEPGERAAPDDALRWAALLAQLDDAPAPPPAADSPQSPQGEPSGGPPPPPEAPAAPAADPAEPTPAAPPAAPPAPASPPAYW
jgi:hypothetical protein